MCYARQGFVRLGFDFVSPEVVRAMSDKTLTHYRAYHIGGVLCEILIAAIESQQASVSTLKLPYRPRGLLK